MTMLPYIASRVLDTPLVIGQAKLEAILAVIGPRIGIEAPASGMLIPDREGLPPPAVMNGDGRRRGANLVTPEGIAVIPVFGTLVKRAGAIEAASGLTSYGHLEDRIMDAATDPAVRAVLLDIDSPGGEAAGVFDLSDLVYEARSLKPVWAVADEEAFSGAYAIASAAERLFVPRTGGLGLIGVVAVHVDRSARDAMEGFRTTTVYAGVRKNDFNPHETLKDGARQTLQAEVDRVYALFVDTVARNRGLTADAVRATKARLFFGEDAVAAGLADEVGTLRDSLTALAVTLAEPRSIIAAPAVLPGPASNQPSNRKEHVMNDETDTVKTERETPSASTAEDPRAAPATADTPPAPVSATATVAPVAPAPAAEPERTAEVVDLDAVRNQARGEGAAEAGLIAELCTLAGMPERTADMLANGLSADAVRRELLNLKAGADAEVHNHVLPGDGTGGPQNLDDNPVVRAATARAAAAKEVCSMNAYSESTYLGDVLKCEAPNLYSRDAVTVLAGEGAERALKVGAVIAARTRSQVTVTAGDSNTGDGAATMADPPLGALAEAGIYRLACITDGADGGTFQVLSPRGYVLPDLTVGGAYAGAHLNLTVADGAADFAVGDTFTIEVSGDGKVVALDPAAVDGTAEAVGIAAYDVTAPDGTDAEVTAILRDAILADRAIVWPAGINEARKNAAIADLEVRGILVRKAA